MLWQTSRIALLSVSLCTLAAFAQNVDMGNKYEELDQKAIRVTTTFQDGLAIATRSANGDIDVILADRSGAQVAELRASATAGISFREFAFPLKALVANSSTALSADWANVQIYSLWQEAGKHRGGVNPRLLWDGDYLSFTGRSASRIATRPSYARPDRSEKVLRVVTDFGSMRAECDRHGGGANWTARLADMESGSTSVEMSWFESSRTLIWTLADGTKGAVQLHTIPGGWPFRPNPAWANIQVYAFYDSYRAQLTSGLKRVDADVANKPPSEALALLDGCTGLHAFDGTVLEQCCNRHDACYNKEDPDCTWLSWIYPRSWECVQCNILAVFCFITGGTFNPPLQDIGGAGGGGSPIIFDLSGRDFAMSGMKDPVHFDVDNDGIEIEATGWTRRGSETGFLCLDLNRNGSIDNGGELFGNHTLLADGSEAAQGFHALQQYDGNRDGRIDATDSVFRVLRIWIDSNHDARTDSGELLTLGKAGVVSIGLESWPDIKVDRHGNEFRYKGDATRLNAKGDREPMLIYDVFLINGERQVRESTRRGF